MKSLEWFKEKIEPILKEYEIKYRFYENGDFGALNQVAFDSKRIAGEIDFWDSGWLSINMWDFEKNDSIMNVFLEPHQEDEKEMAFNELQKKISSYNNL